ncbi:MAG TPA: Wzz/FepE/Etk N-terminal domain-containing protein [Verrucomicrobiae bacterium]|nr:Wzz/FepE/Etk N-terminal domain-containing protein [Verrucomicrobiae bacterium]
MLPPESGGAGHGPHYRLTTMVPKRRFLSYLRERWWMVLICLVCALAVVLVYETVRTPRYHSFAQLYLSSDAPVSAMGFVTEDSQNYFGTQIELLKSARLRNGVYEQLHVDRKPGRKAPLVDINVAQPLRTSLLNVEANGSDPELVQRFLKELIDQYLAYKKETRLASSEDLLNSVTEQVALKGTSLETEQEKWSEFQKTNNVAVLEEDGKSAGMYLSDLNLQLAKLRLEHKILTEVSNAVPAKATATATNLPATPALSAAAAETTTNQVSQDDDTALKNARVEVAVFLGNKDDEIRTMGQHRFDEELARRQQYVSILENDQGKRKALQIQDLEKRIAAIVEAIPVWEARMLDINQRLAQAQQLKNNIARQQEFYDHLLGTMQSVDLSKNVQQERLAVLQPPTPAAPERRSLPLRIVLAAIGGIALSLGIVFLWYLLDDRLVSVRDISDQFGETVLGLVPQIRVPRANPEKALLDDDDSRTAYAESFRHLRSALILSSPGNASPSQTLLFTSAMPDEGKTTVAVNVARVLARSGLRVALVDADLHSGGNRKFFGDPNGHGLIDFLRNEVGMDLILRPSDILGLTMVSRGPRNVDTEGLFLRPRLEELLAHLREQNDFVILDCAPVLSADNSALLVPHADSVVLVTRPFHTRSRLIRRALDMLYQRRARQVTIILNRARAEDLTGHYAANGMDRSEKNGHAVSA